MQRLTGTSPCIEIEKCIIIPRCHNCEVGAGNCPGMVKYGTCPAVRAGIKYAKFSGCEDFIKKYKDASQSSSEN